MNRRSAGFTLLELVVAIAVASLLVSLVYGAVRIGQRSASAIEELANAAEMQHIGWDFLHRALSNTRAVIDPEDTEDRTGFLGRADALRFVADMPGYVVPGGLVRISVSEADGEDDRRQLRVDYARYDGDSVEDAPADDAGLRLQAVLVDDLERVEFSYLGAAADSETPSWQDSWDDARRLPNLVKIRVVPRDGRAWPVIIARPIANTDLLDETANTTVPLDGEPTEDPATEAEDAS